MKYLVPLVLLFLTLAFWLAIDEKANLGRSPDDEEVILTQERNKVTGELYNLQIVRCRICGQVISYVQSNLRGKIVHGYLYTHRCGKYGNRQEARYKGSATWDTFNLYDFLEHWQRRLRFHK